MGLISNFEKQTSSHASSPPSNGPTSTLARFVLLTGGYYALAELIRFAVDLPDLASPFWPPAALALVACLTWGMRMVPAVWLGAALALLTAGVPLLPASIIALGTSLEAAAGTFLFRRLYPRRPNFIYYRNISHFIGGVLLTATVGATIGAATLSAIGSTGLSVFAATWLRWWVGDTSGLLVGMPLLLAWNITAGTHWRPAKIAEAVAYAILLTLVAHFAFNGSFGGYPLAYLPVPFVLWMAFRFNLSAAAWSTGIVCAFSVWNTALGRGPFAGADPALSLMLLMAYMCVISVAGLALAHTAYQRDRAETALIAERDSLERRVRRRTAALIEDIEARKRVEQELAVRERQLEEAQNLAQVGSWNWDVLSRTIIWSNELYRIFGVDREHFAITPENCRPLIHPQDIDALRKAIETCLRTGQPFYLEHRIVQPGGSTRIVTSRGMGSKDADGRVFRLNGTMQDVTEARRAEASLREAEERYRQVVELSPDAILVQQDDTLVFANQAAVALLGARSIDDLVGRPMIDFVHPDFHQLLSERVAHLQQGEKPRTIDGKFVCVNGSVIDVEISSSPFQHKGAFASLFLARNVTERKRTTEQMAYLAHYDSLTGLPNRMLFSQRLEHALSIAQRPERSLEILFLDLDRFKNINDTLGHAAGDAVLREAAHRLRSSLRGSDTVARLSGDEFVVLIENVDEPLRGATVAEKILTAFAPPFLRDKNPITVGTSIGISSFPADGEDADTLLKKADVAMYRAKKSGRNSYRYYSPELNRHTTERQLLETALSHAVEYGQLSLHYQPKVDILGSRISGMEALLRWRHPTLGDVSPQRFIPVAEETGLIKPIGYWAIRTACEQNKLWQVSSPLRLKVAVNLSPRQLADDKLIENVGEILADTGLEPRYLELEITESAIMVNQEKSLLLLESLHAMGVSVAIDDFGSGFSSLAYLKRLPIHTVKIDRSFVQGVPSDRNDSAVTKIIINLAHSLDCNVIAEGTETQQQYDFLREQDCDSVQGYYFGAAMPAEQFGDLLRTQPNLHLH